MNKMTSSNDESKISADKSLEEELPKAKFLKKTD